MADFSDKEYWLAKEIEQLFRKTVDPELLCDHLAGTCLSEDDVDRVSREVRNNGKSAAAGELLDRLRRRPNWVNYLLEACNHPELKLEHLAKLIKEKSTEFKIKVTIKCSDGENCGEDSSVAEASSSDQLVAKQVDEADTPSEQFLKTFKARVDPQDFLQYLTRFKEKDQDAVKCKQQQGRTEAAEELVSRLLGYKHWKNDLQEALRVPGSGLEDLGDTLSNIDDEEFSFQTRLQEAINASKSNPVISVEDKRKQIVQEFLHHLILDVKLEDPDKLQEAFRLTENVNAFLLKLENGSLIITVRVSTVESLEAVQRLYLGGLLGEALRKDLLSESRVHYIKQVAEKNGIKSTEMKQYANVDNLEFDVEIDSLDIQYCQQELILLKDVSIPATSIQSVAQFEFSHKSNKTDSSIFNMIGPSVLPIIRAVLADPFVQCRYRDIIPLLECSPTEMLPAKLIQWLYKELDTYVTSHMQSKMLLDLGSELAAAEEQPRHMFRIKHQKDSVEILISAEGRDRVFVLDIKTWEGFVQEGIIEFSEEHQLYCFRSSLLEQYLIKKADPSSSKRLNRFFLILKMAENPTGFIESLAGFPAEPSEMKMEYLYLHYLLMKEVDPVRKLDALKTIVRTVSVWKVYLREEPDAHQNILQILVLEKLIDKLETTFDENNVELWDLSEKSVRKSVLLPNIDILIKMARVVSGMGSVQIDVTVNAKGEKMADVCLKAVETSSLPCMGCISIKLSGESLSPDEVDLFCSGLLKVSNLNMLDLSTTSKLKPEDYRHILKSCRYTQLSSLVLCDTSLVDQENPRPIGLQYLPNLKCLEMERCNLGDRGIHAMSSDFRALSKLTEISVAQNKITSSGITELSALLMDKENLRILRVHENGVGFEGAVSLSVLFRNLPLLEVINLCNCKGLSDKGFEMIVESLRGKNLKKMNVRKCGFTQRTAMIFFNLLKDMPHFQHLDYGCNSIGESFGKNTGISESFLEMMSCNKNSWDHLSLWNCQLGLTSVFSSNDRLHHLSTLTDICLQENNLSDRQGICIGEYLKTSWHSLRVLNLRHNEIGDDGASAILEGVRANPNLKEFFLDRNVIRDFDLIIEMAHFFLDKKDEARLREMDVSYNEVSDTNRYLERIRRNLKSEEKVRFRDCGAYMEISTENRSLKV